MKALSVPAPKLSQGTIVVGTLMAAWVFWLASQNKLLVYWQLLLGQYSGSSGSTGATQTAPSAPGSSVSSVAGSATTTSGLANSPALGGYGGTGYSPPALNPLTGL